MKRLLFLILGCLVPFLNVSANDFDKQERINFVKDFFKSKERGGIANLPDSFYVSHEDVLGGYSVVSRQIGNEKRQSGYAVVSTINKQPIVLAYDTKSSFRTDNLPAHIRTWLDGYAAAMSLASSNSNIEEIINASLYGTEDVAPLLNSTMWDQGEPYNMLCPIINGENCLTGCVATAIAQIMSYHKYPQKGNGSCHYIADTNKFDISFDFDNTWFDWTNIHERYGALSVEQDEQYYITSNGLLSFLNFGVNESSSSLLEIFASGFFVNDVPYIAGDLTLLLLDRNGDFVRQVSKQKSVDINTFNDKGEGYRFSVAVPSDIDDGAYKICLAFRANGGIDWDVVFNPIYTSKSYIDINKVGNMLFVGEEYYPCASSFEHSLPIATLMAAAGAAVKMDYGVDGSGAYDENVPTGLNKYLGYDNDMALLYLEDYSDSLWHRLLQKELLEGRPVYYSGSSSSGGHAFVIDGMQANEETRLVYYHVNWGWGGLCDGYYLLNMLRPSVVGTGGESGSNYSNNASMITGIMPEDNIDHLRLNCKGLWVNNQDLFPGQNLSVDVECLMLQSSISDFQGSLYIDIIKKDNEENEVALSFCVLDDFTITSTRELSNHHARIVLPDMMETGEYKVSLSCKNTNGEKIEITMGNTPYINVRSLDDWRGGTISSTHQYVSFQECFIDRLSSSDERIVLRINTLSNLRSNSISGKTALLVCAPSGRVLMPLDEWMSLRMGGYYQNNTLSLGGAFSKNMPDGQYCLRLGFMPNFGTQWTFLYQATSAEWLSDLSIFEIPFEVTNGTILIDGMFFSSTDYPWTNVVQVLNDKEMDESISYDISGRVICPQNPTQLFIKNGKIYIDSLK